MTLMEHCGLSVEDNEDLFWHGLIGNRNFIFDNIIIIPCWNYEGTAPSGQPYNVLKFVAYDLKNEKELWQYEITRGDNGGAFINPFAHMSKFESSYAYNYDKGIMVYTTADNRALLFNKSGFIKSVTLANRYSHIIYVSKSKKFFFISLDTNSINKCYLYMADGDFNNITLVDTFYNYLASSITLTQLIYNNYDNVIETKVQFGTPSNPIYMSYSVYDINGNKTLLTPKVLVVGNGQNYTRVQMGNILKNGDIIQVSEPGTLYINSERDTNVSNNTTSYVFDYELFPKQNKMIVIGRRPGTSDYEDKNILILYDLMTKSVVKVSPEIEAKKICYYYMFKDNIYIVGLTTGGDIKIHVYDLELNKVKFILIDLTKLNKVYSSYIDFGIFPMFMPSQVNNLDYYYK